MRGLGALRRSCPPAFGLHLDLTLQSTQPPYLRDWLAGLLIVSGTVLQFLAPTLFRPDTQTNI